MKKILSVILVVVMLFSFASCGSKTGASTPEKAASEFVTAILFKIDTQKLADLSPDFYIEYACEDLGIENPSRKAFVEALNEQLAMYGDVSVEGEVLNAKAYYENDDIDEYLDDLTEYYGATSEDIKKISDSCIVEVKVYSKEYDEYDTLEVFCIKMDGRWYVIYD